MDQWTSLASIAAACAPAAGARAAEQSHRSPQLEASRSTPPSPSSFARHALVVCDMQPDALAALPGPTRLALLYVTRMAVEAARAACWPVVFVGLRFPAGYEGVDPKHRLCVPPMLLATSAS